MQMGVRIATFTGNGIDAFHIFRPHAVQHIAYQPHTFIFAHAWFHSAIQFIISSIYHHSRHVQQGDFILGFDDPRLLHELLAVYHIQAFFL
jgi:hypothetical protein